MLSSCASPCNPEETQRRPEWPGIAAATREAADSARRWTGKLPAVLPAAMALAAVAVCTWGSFRLGQTAAFTGFLYLVFVVLAALYGGFWQATAVSMAAA